METLHSCGSSQIYHISPDTGSGYPCTSDSPGTPGGRQISAEKSVDLREECPRESQRKSVDVT